MVHGTPVVKEGVTCREPPMLVLSTVRGLDRRRSPTHEGTLMTPSAAQQLAAFIAKFDPATAQVIRQCRTKLRRRFPTAVELVYDNYNFFVIGYCATERSSDCVVSLAAASNGVGLSFYYGSSLPDPEKLLLGSGAQNRFIRLPTAAVLDSPGVKELIAAAERQAKTPMPDSGRGRLVIRSISAKQRPRRPAASSPRKARKRS
jgi:hypothetical protein